jgi:serine/threonine protein kinase
MGLAAEFSDNFWNATQSSRVGSFSTPAVVDQSETAPPLPLDLKGDNHLLAEEQINDQSLIRKTTCGTPMYQAPEMLNAYVTKQAYGPSIDIWSLGVMMFHFLSGDWPFDLDNWVASIKSVKSSKDKKRIFAKMMSEMQMPIEFFKLTAKCSDDCIHLMTRLLQFHVEDRIGCSFSSGTGLKEVMNHPFFSDTNWSCILQKQVRSLKRSSDSGHCSILSYILFTNQCRRSFRRTCQK